MNKPNYLTQDPLLPPSLPPSPPRYLLPTPPSPPRYLLPTPPPPSLLAPHPSSLIKMWWMFILVVLLLVRLCCSFIKFRLSLRSQTKWHDLDMLK